MNRIVAILFALSCFVTSFTSGGMLGVGMWFWIIIATGAFVAVSQFLPTLQRLGGMIAGLAGMLAVIALLLTLAAATIGGSFKLNNSESLLLFGFFLVAVFGVTLSRLNKNPRTVE
jgi:hypothetical protein